MSGELLDHDLVALLEDTSVKHFRTGEPLRLRRGQLGTVVMMYADGDVEVEFALKTKTNPIGVAEYELQPRLPAEFKGRLPTARQLAAVVREALP